MPGSGASPSAPTPPSRAEAIQLLGYYYSLAPPRWQNLQSFVSVFITVDLALLGATVSVLDKFNRWPGNLVLVTAPITAFVIGALAKTAIRKQDRHIRELIVVIGHLEQYLGLNSAPPMQGQRDFWPDDTSFLPTRWVGPRTRSRSSDEFVESTTVGGTAGAALWMFTFVQILCVSLAVGIGLAPLLP